MPRLRHVTALLAGALLLHLTWVVSGVACVMPDMESPSETATGIAVTEMSDAEMAGMNMSGAGQSSSDAPAHDHAPCDFPWAPDGCQSMAPCAPMAVVSHAPALRAADSVVSSITAHVVLIPASQVRAPEFPPPRA